MTMFRILNLEFRDYLGFRILKLGFRGHLVFRISRLGFRSKLGFRILNLGFRGHLVFRVLCLGFFVAALFYAHGASAGIIAKPPSNLGLVGYWSMNEGTGTVAGDGSGNGNRGTLTNGPTWVDGKRGKALNFDGVDDVVNAGSAAVLDNLTASTFSVSAWIYPRSMGGSFFMKRDSSGNAGWSSHIYDSNGRMRVSITRLSGLNRITSNNAINTNVWQHVVFTWSGGTLAANIKIYINGKETTYSYTEDINGTLDNDSANPLTIGGESDGGSPFPGLIDDVRVYNRALSATEVQALYKSGVAKFAPPTDKGLVGYWSMNEGTGTVAGDGSGNGNRGTLTNGPTWVDGKRGKALNFDGSNDTVSLANLGVNTAASAKNTVSFWMYKRVGGGTANYSMPFGFNSYDLTFNSDSNSFGFNTRNSDVLGVSSDGLLNRWVHVVGVFFNGTPSSTNNDLYIDGVRQTITLLQGSSVSRSVSSGANISGWFYDSNYKFNGLIDDVRVYNRALSATEIQALYNTGAAKFAPPTDKGLVGYWSMNEGTGTVAGDGSGNGNRGTLTNGPTWVDGKKGKALNFDGTSQGVSLGNPASLPSGTSPFTFSAWIYPKINQDGIIIGKLFTGSEVIHLRFNRSANVVEIRYVNTVPTPFNANSTTLTTAMLNKWTLITGVADGSSLHLYVNGVQESSDVAYSGSQRTGAGTAWGIGKDFANNGTYFAGLIDEVRVYNRALSAAEIQTLYNSR